VTRRDEAAKDALRTKLRSLGLSITSQESRDSAVSAAAMLVAWDGFASSSEIVAFSSLSDEMDSSPFHEVAILAGKRVLLPRMVGESLEFAAVTQADDLIGGRFGVREPNPSCPVQRVDARAIVLVPGVAFDRAGGRLGRGAGYYDRALAEIREYAVNATFIGVGFSHQIVDRVPMMSHDVRMDAILSDANFLWVECDGLE